MEGSRTASYTGHCARAARELLQAADTSNGGAQRGEKALVLAEEWTSDTQQDHEYRNKREEQDYSAAALPQVQGDLFRLSCTRLKGGSRRRWRVGFEARPLTRPNGSAPAPHFGCVCVCGHMSKRVSGFPRSAALPHEVRGLQPIVCTVSQLC